MPGKAVLCAAALCLCCAPTIKTFTVRPHPVCRGAGVTATWETSNAVPMLTVAPVGHPAVSQALTSAAGSEPFTIFTPTNFVLLAASQQQASGWTQQLQSIDMFYGADTQVQRLTFACRGATAQTARLVGDPAALRVLSVSADQAALVTHDGRAAALAANAASPELRDTAFDGDYVVELGEALSRNCLTPGVSSVAVNLTVVGMCAEILPGGSRWVPGDPTTHGVGGPPDLGTCGGSGQRCCNVVACNQGLSCSAGSCSTGAPAVDRCHLPGGTPHPYGFREPSGCAYQEGRAVIYTTATEAEARACADRDAAALGATAVASPLLHQFTYCGTNSDRHYPLDGTVLDEADAESCAQSQCLSCKLTPGECAH